MVCVNGTVREILNRIDEIGNFEKELTENLFKDHWINPKSNNDWVLEFYEQKKVYAYGISYDSFSENINRIVC